MSFLLVGAVQRYCFSAMMSKGISFDSICSLFLTDPFFKIIRDEPGNRVPIQNNNPCSGRYTKPIAMLCLAITVSFVLFLLIYYPVIVLKKDPMISPVLKLLIKPN